jgi:ParB family chromosome partitioning protein
MNEFQLVSGHRRVRASKIAGLTEIPALLKEIDDKEMAAECLVENMQRKQLSVIEEARGYRELLKLGHTLKEISTIAGKSRPAISNALRLLRLDPFVQLAVLHKTITPWHARTILALPEDIEQYRVVDLITDWNLTIEELKKIVQDILNGEELISWRRQVPLSGLFCPHERKNDCFDIDLYDSMKM